MADLRVGIAGLGIASRQVIPAFKQAPGVTLTAVADVRPEALEEVGSWLGVKKFSSTRWNGPSSARDWEEDDPWPTRYSILGEPPSCSSTC